MMKAAYVLAQGQTREHACHWPGCTKQVPPAMWGCKEHWFMLPKHLRDAIWRAYVPGQEATGEVSRGYFRAADDAQRWIHQTFGDRQIREPDPMRWSRLVAFVRERDEQRRTRRAGEQLELGLAGPEPYKPPTRCLP
jgi:hypothetical protein